jgi:hypothetical protein
MPPQTPQLDAPLWAQLLPFAIIALVLALRWRRRDRHQRVRTGALWVAPAIAVLFMGFGLWAMPHLDKTPLTFAALALGLALGIGAGIARAHTVKLSLHPETGEVMAQTGSYAILLLIVLFAVRYAARAEFASGHPALVFIEASMLFALGMIVTQRLATWRRIRQLRAGPA